MYRLNFRFINLIFPLFFYVNIDVILYYLNKLAIKYFYISLFAISFMYISYKSESEKKFHSFIMNFLSVAQL